jgi:poly-gamma-glutamate synthesis protein (capsule biosynthesis protein)
MHGRARPHTTPFAALALVLALLLLAVACGTDDAGPVSNGTIADGSPAPEVEGAESTTTTRALRTVTIAGSGDILMHTPVNAAGLANGGGQVHDFGPMFAAVAPEISAADVAICHMETPISPDGANVSGYPIFNAPTEIAEALATAGFDGCDTASNHTLDKGFDGAVATLDVLEAAGLKHTGSFRTEAEAANGGGVLYDANGVSVGHLAYSMDTNGIPIPVGKEWVINLNDPDKMLADAAALKAAGAEIVVMSVHWGAEYQAQPTPYQIDLANKLLASPNVDLILGDHVHVVQPTEKIGDKYVVYGMGNFLSNQSPAAGLIASSQDGSLYSFDFTEQADGRFVATAARVTPTFVTRPGYVITPAGPDNLNDSFERTVEAVNLLGAGTNDLVFTTGAIPPELLPPPPSTTTTATPRSTTTTTAPSGR